MEEVQTSDQPAAPFQPIATFEELKSTLDKHHAPNSIPNVGERLACMILSVDESRLREISTKWKEGDWPEAEFGECGPLQPIVEALESLSTRRALVDEALRRAILVLGEDADDTDDKPELSSP